MLLKLDIKYGFNRHTVRLSAKPQNMCDIHIIYSESDVYHVNVGQYHCHDFHSLDCHVQKTVNLLLPFSYSSTHKFFSSMPSVTTCLQSTHPYGHLFSCFNFLIYLTDLKFLCIFVQLRPTLDFISTLS